MAYSTLATQADDPTAGPDHTWFEAVLANEDDMVDGFGAKISHAAPQTCGTTATYQVLLGTVDYDSSPSMCGTANRLTVPTGRGGLWLVTANLTGSALSTGGSSMSAKVRKNNTTDLWGSYVSGIGVAGATVVLCAPFTVQLSVADYLEMYVVTSAMAGSFSAREDLGVFLAMEWLSP